MFNPDWLLKPISTAHAENSSGNTFIYPILEALFLSTEELCVAKAHAFSSTLSPTQRKQ